MITKASNKKIMKKIVFLVLGIVAVLYLVLVLLALSRRALIIEEDNAKINLCESAQVTGNEKWLGLCGEYYAGGNIAYLRGIN
jgi:hypothetical protein